MSDKRMERASKHDRMFLGVASGIANYMGVDPVFVRLFFALATIIGNGLGLILYVILALIMPEGDSPKASIIDEDEEVVIKGA